MAEIHDVQEPVMQYAERKGFLVRRMRYIGRRACADVYLFKGGRTFQIEFKDLGGKPTAQQRREHERMLDHGIVVYIVDDADAGKALVDSLGKNL
jgi:hypothetical protein